MVELLGEGRLGANELVVVGQGTVDAALSLRPEERRQLFEEAAGVKGLQVKRNEASGRLTRSLDNLTRVSDLIGELKPQVRRLAMQAEHQQQHDTLGARARALVITSHRRREHAARAELGDARRRAAAAEAALAAYRAEQEAGRSAVTAAEARYWEAEEASRATATARQEAREELIRLDGRLEAIAAREAELVATVAREEHELAAAETSLASWSTGPPATPWSRPSRPLPRRSRPGGRPSPSSPPPTMSCLPPSRPCPSSARDTATSSPRRLASPRRRLGTKLGSSTRSTSGRRPSGSSAS